MHEGVCSHTDAASNAAEEASLLAVLARACMPTDDSTPLSCDYECCDLALGRSYMKLQWPIHDDVVTCRHARTSMIQVFTKRLFSLYLEQTHDTTALHMPSEAITSHGVHAHPSC